MRCHADSEVAVKCAIYLWSSLSPALTGPRATRDPADIDSRNLMPIAVLTWAGLYTVCSSGDAR